ncbi:MAG: RNA polymerase sigma factor region1.1 domain-containing protein [Blautia sp.]|jgi:RNA polymerase primary sigma factor
MDVVTFQKKLEDILTLAKINGKRISKEGAALFFKEDGLSGEQMEKVYDYLRLQGIRILGEDAKEEEPKDAAAILDTQADPLDEEEVRYLDEYTKGLKAPGTGTLLEKFMWDVVEIAKELHHKEMFIGDLIAEGNICLLTALDAAGENPEKEAVQETVRQGMKEVLKEQGRLKYQDEFLVEKVRHLEASIKELSDGVGEKSSIEELSAYLDMEEEEIRAVLRLTGDLEG